jgi:hypothetical protein
VLAADKPLTVFDAQQRMARLATVGNEYRGILSYIVRQALKAEYGGGNQREVAR